MCSRAVHLIGLLALCLGQTPDIGLIAFLDILSDCLGIENITYHLIGLINALSRTAN